MMLSPGNARGKLIPSSVCGLSSFTAKAKCALNRWTRFIARMAPKMFQLPTIKASRVWQRWATRCYGYSVQHKYVVF